jgi:hypothetical protein
VIGPEDRRLRILLIDQITFASLVRVLAIGQSLQEIWHFEPIGPTSRLWLAVLCKLGLLHAKVRQVNHHIGKARNNSGESQYLKSLADARAICSTIRREQLSKNPLIKAMKSGWEIKKVLFHFEKLVEIELRLECVRIRLTLWILRNQLSITPREAALMIKRSQWFSYLKAYSASEGIRLIGYRPWRFPMISELVRRVLRLFVRVTPSPGKAVRRCFRWLTTNGRRLDSFSTGSGGGSGTIALRYWHRKLSFDSTERSEFFWLKGSGIPYSEVLLYDYVTERPLDPETLDQINAKGLRILGCGPEIPSWCPTPRAFAVFIRTLGKITLGVLTCLARNQCVSPYYVSKLMALAMDYAFWYDFYANHRVRVNVGTLNTSVGQILALNALNGISVAYQYSVSPIFCPTSLLSSGEDVQFVLSPLFKELWLSIEPPVEAYVCTGFIYDSAVRAVRCLDRIKEVRERLQDKGARLILCFFDENSLDRWDYYATHDDATNDYEYLLKWLLDDPTLGLLFKPKKSKDLYRRIARVAGLIDQAERTGRCTFLMSDTLVGSMYPAEAALAADICIGKLDGSTAALEARLAGVPALLIDIDGFLSHPFYAWGRGRILFSDWESLRSAVEQYRAAPQARPDLGDWSPGLSDLDPFQDGQASLRMGLYIRSVYEALERGEPKERALALAADEFVRRWGNEHTTLNNSTRSDGLRVYR